jgi:hypothetical protein
MPGRHHRRRRFDIRQQPQKVRMTTFLTSWLRFILPPPNPTRKSGRKNNVLIEVRSIADSFPPAIS